MKAYIVGEDDATKTIIKKILEYCGGVDIITELPVRGGRIKEFIRNYNNLSFTSPVILLTDLDNNSCAPEFIRKLGIETRNVDFVVNIAVDEAEAWLMADRDNFAKYFQIDISTIPQSSRIRMNGPREVTELDFPYKSSLYLTRQIMPTSRNQILKEQMIPVDGAVKGKEYNSAIKPFITDSWNIDIARTNSDSLNRMIVRIQNLMARYI